MDITQTQFSHPSCIAQYVEGCFATTVDRILDLTKVKDLPATHLVPKSTEIPLGGHDRLKSRLLVGVCPVYGEYTREDGFLGTEDVQERAALAIAVSLPN
jgi:hypothetical protein